ncbi:DNA glycosylase AlkZ-like family protein [Gryllotalpicola ginsengisoli]|uniref:DNA glycosylase AlkZ-like family protein n=1 Tax=Gryllotalpicola ginsengisoli TaxID=444608 RepID=UPI0012DED48C|nr:crosslink repair DNA glycosylase YcaQ family protein [Gryllotalpicola ginsengisoli]
MELTAERARRMRVRSHVLDGSDLEPAAVVQRAIALQGQDLPAVLRAIAIRSRPGTTVAEVRAAFDTGALVRSWPMRGTLFATTPEHLAALLHFTSERTHRAAARRREQLGLTDEVVARARDVLAEALAAHPLRRAEALDLLIEAGIDAVGGRGYHLLMHLCVDGLAHWGPFDDTGTEQLLVRSTTAAPADPDAALAAVVRGYIAARGPVSETDLAWWTKLPRAALRRAAEAIEDLVEVRVEGSPAWVVGEPHAPEPSGVILVPGFDEWILGYADRSLVASPAMLDAIVPGGNGVFRPAVLVDGVAVGTWRASRSARSGPPAVELIERVPAGVRRAIEKAVAAWPHG